MKSISDYDLTTFNCASGEITALIDLWLEGMKKFIDYYSSIPEELLDKKIDDEGETPISAGKHVLLAVLGHAAWCLELAGLPGPYKDKDKFKEVYSSAKSISTRKEVIALAQKLMTVIPESLSPMTNDHLSHQGITAWGENMSSEGMVEHTIMHIYRHMRQLKMRL